ncbi:MAG: cation-translocating P-type ATPase [Nitrospiraceae bacterium]|nr:cation-translocating P-type ATPase [Nitrospiraceae bacterium]
MRPHQQSVAEAFAALGSSDAGLSGQEARERLDRFGSNELEEQERKTPFRMFLDQFGDFMIIVLIVAAVISGIIGEASDTIAIIVILVLNAILGFVQEYRAERAMAALRKMAASSATVLRDNLPVRLPAARLVPGDVVLLDAGSVVPADLRLIEVARLKAEEAALTGESVPVEKHTAPLPDEDLPLGDRRNMLFKGTFVTYGRGRGVVTATGMETELGRIARMLQETGEGKTPLQKRLAHFGKRITIAVLVICAIVFAGGLVRGEEPVNIFLVAVSLAVAAIPEALPAVVTIALALGARKMVKQNALVRKLPAVETLGSVTYICTDKTGTLTLNRMTVEEIWCDGRTETRQGDKETRGQGETAGKSMDDISSPGRPLAVSPRRLFYTALALSNDAHADPAGTVLGDPTEVALFSAARERGFEKPELERNFPRVAELPFDSDRKLMTTFHEMQGPGARDQGPGLNKGSLFSHDPASPRSSVLSFTKGAVEVVLERSSGVLTADGVAPLDRKEVEAVAERIAADGLRVMAIGMRTWETPPALDATGIEGDLVLVGFMGLMDPPREEARKAVLECRAAGITPVMITGDHPLTARAVARRVGILDGDDPEAVITGRELDALPFAEFEARVERIRVYARVAPEQKLTIVRALQDRGHFVAMTGDGVNDAPALKRADIGVSMGVTGTDVAKEASSMILLDDNFATIVKAVGEGRKIYDNVRKFIRYLLSTNSGEIWTLFLAPFLGLPMPLQPIHILWINLVTDGLPALALSLEPAERGLMRRPPRHPQEGLFSHGLGVHAVWVGLLMAAVVLGLQAWAIHISDSHWQTMVFITLCLLQLGHVMAIRSEQDSLFTQGLLSNKALLLTVAGTILLQLATVFVPGLHSVFKTQSLTVTELALVFGLSTIVFIAVEIEKWLRRRAARNLA